MKKIKITIILLMLAFVFTGCGKTTPVVEIDNSGKQETEEGTNNQDKQGQTEIDPEILEIDIDYCTKPPEHADNGRLIYPINIEKYGNEEFGHIGFLGELFTAHDCGDKRFAQLFRGEDAVYDDGLKIWLNKTSEPLVKTLERIGFQCDSDLDSECYEWVIYDSVNLKELLGLKQFHSFIKLTDCRNCG